MSPKDAKPVLSSPPHQNHTVTTLLLCYRTYAKLIPLPACQHLPTHTGRRYGQEPQGCSDEAQIRFTKDVVQAPRNATENNAAEMSHLQDVDLPPDNKEAFPP